MKLLLKLHLKLQRKSIVNTTEDKLDIHLGTPRITRCLL